MPDKHRRDPACIQTACKVQMQNPREEVQQWCQRTIAVLSAYRIFPVNKHLSWRWESYLKESDGGWGSFQGRPPCTRCSSASKDAEALSASTSPTRKRSPAATAWCQLAEPAQVKGGLATACCCSRAAPWGASADKHSYHHAWWQRLFFVFWCQGSWQWKDIIPCRQAGSFQNYKTSHRCCRHMRLSILWKLNDLCYSCIVYSVTATTHVLH